MFSIFDRLEPMKPDIGIPAKDLNQEQIALIITPIGQQKKGKGKVSLFDSKNAILYSIDPEEHKFMRDHLEKYAIPNSQSDNICLPKNLNTAEANAPCSNNINPRGAISTSVPFPNNYNTGGAASMSMPFPNNYITGGAASTSTPFPNNYNTGGAASTSTPFPNNYNTGGAASTSAPFPINFVDRSDMAYNQKGVNCLLGNSYRSSSFTGESGTGYDDHMMKPKVPIAYPQSNQQFDHRAPLIGNHSIHQNVQDAQSAPWRRPYRRGFREKGKRWTNTSWRLK